MPSATLNRKSKIEQQASKMQEFKHRREDVFSYDDAVLAARMFINPEDEEKPLRLNLSQCCVCPKYKNNNKNDFYVIKPPQTQEKPWEMVLGDKPKMLEMHAF